MKSSIATFALIVVFVLAGCWQQQAPSAGRSLSAPVKRSPWTSSQSGGEILTTANYRIYTTSRTRHITQILPPFMEAAHKHYLELTGLTDRPVGERMPIYMMSSRQEWISLSEQVFGERQQPFHAIQAGGYCYKGICVFWDLGGIQTFSVASHEGLHQFFFHRLKSPLPLWLEEGLCTAAEGHELDGTRVRFTPERNNSRFTGLRDTILHERWMTITELLPLGGGDVAVQGTECAIGYYSQLWALALFLRSHPTYRVGMERLMADAEAGRFAQTLNLPPALARIRHRNNLYNRSLAEPLFRRYITDDLAAFDAEYLAFAKKLADLQF